MTTIAEGMTPVEFLNALNGNFTLGLIDGFTTITDLMDGTELQNALNGNFSKTDSLVGIKGSSFISLLNNNFSAWGLPIPTGLTVVWVDDFVRITFNDESGVSAKHEIWEKVESEDYVLVATLDEGVEIYEYKTWQNTNVQYKIRAKTGSLYSGSATSASILTPWVFYTDQRTAFTRVLFHEIQISGVNSIDIDWGDGNMTNDYVYGASDEVFHDYTVSGEYYIQIGGSNNEIIWLEVFEQDALTGTDVSKWKLPPVFIFGHFNSNHFIGDITNLELPDSCRGAHFALNDITADISDWSFPANYFDFHVGSYLDGGIYGDITTWVMPTKASHLSISGDLTGDLTDWALFIAPSYTSVVVKINSTNATGFTGDLSGWLINDIVPTYLDMRPGCHFTKLPRGNFKNVNNYNFNANSCNTTEIDNILAYIDNYFSGGVVPLLDCAYILDGLGMGIPSAAGLASKASIEGKYTAAGKIATITVNS